MLGCASLPGTDPEAAAVLLGFLHHHVLAPKGMRPRALPDRFVPTDRVPADSVDARAALRQLPQLLRAYLRLGGMIGEGAVVDRQFNTIDVCLVLPTERVQASYLRHYRHGCVSAAAA
jgi:L-ornithine Nalpha-acyltransferase